jgi:2-polyprenyl-6-methoxyphenol hydroxylase-like FAD-dependent oxidoreductase
MTNGPVVAPWDKSVLISGIGVAGPTLAYWLALYGFKTALVEKSPQLRTGGYIIDFWGRGFDVAEKMGIPLPKPTCQLSVNLLALRLQWFESTPAHTSPPSKLEGFVGQAHFRAHRFTCRQPQAR